MGKNNTRITKILAAILAAAIMLTLVPLTALGATDVAYIDEAGTQQIQASTTNVTAGTTTWGTTGQEKWYSVSGNVNILARVTVNGDVRLILTDGSALTASEGIGVNATSSLTIYAQSTDADTMGALTATGSSVTSGDNQHYYSGIGGSIIGNTSTGTINECGTVTINGGVVNAIGGFGGAGIGGSYHGSGGTIYINGGVVTATGNSAAGIGGGSAEHFSGGGSGGNITITDGIVVANGGFGAAGIGGGPYGGSGGTIVISGGDVTATGSNGGAGIGGGMGGFATSEGGSGGNITISGGIVRAYGSAYSYNAEFLIGGAGIGGGGTVGYDSGGSGGTINITGGTVIAAGGGVNGAGIGGGGALSIGANYSGGDAGAISITNATVVATGGGYGAGIGAGDNSDGTKPGNAGTLNISDSVVIASSVSASLTPADSVLIAGDSGAVYGDVTLKHGETLIIEEGVTLTVPVGTTLTVEPGATLVNNGTLNNQGTVIANGTIGGTGSNTGSNITGSYKIDISTGEAVTTYGPFIYTGSAITPAVTVTCLGQTLTSGDYTVTYANNINAGTAGYTATAATSSAYIGAKQGTFTIAKANQATLSITPPGAKTYGDIPFALSTTGGSGTGAVSYEVVSGPGYIVIDSNVLVITGAGDITLKATKAADNNYYVATSAELTVTVSPKTLTVTGIAFADKSYDGTTDVTMNGTPTLSGIINSDDVTLNDDGVSYAFASANVGTGVAVNRTVDYGLDGEKAGNYTLTQPTGPFSASITQAAPTLTLAVTGDTTRPGSVTLTATLPSYVAGSVTFTANGEAVGNAVPLSGGVATTTFTPTTAINNYTFKAGYAGNANCAADDDTKLWDFSIGEQTALTITGLNASYTYGDGTITLATSGGSGSGEVTYTITDGFGVASVSGNQLTILKPGAFTVGAEKAGDNNYNGTTAPSVEVAVNPKPLTITNAAISTKTYDGNTAAAVASVTLDEDIDGLERDVDYTVSGAFNSADVSAADSVTVTVALTGTAKAQKYTLTSATYVLGGQSITPAEITGFALIDDLPVGRANDTLYANASEVAGALPTEVTAIWSGGAFTVPVTSWDDTDGYDPTAAGSYTFTAALTLPANYANSGGYTATAEVVVEPETIITIAAIPGVAPPVRGEIHVTEITETAEYTGTVTWTPAVTDRFAAGTTYTATITLTPKPGWTLTGVTANFFTVAGAEASNAADSGAITAVFPRTGVIYIPLPDDGKSKNDETKPKPDEAEPTEPNEPAETNPDVPVKSSFIDISETDWFYVDVAFVQERGLMTGVSATEFAPTAKLTRSMLVTILYRYASVGDGVLDVPPSSSPAFTDVPSNQWYSDAVTWAAANGIVTGVGDNKFAPDEYITREQFATVLYRFAKEQWSVGSDQWSVDGAAGDLAAYTDAGDVSSWAADAMNWAVSAGLINGVGNGKVAPLGEATRAEAAALLKRYIENMG